MQTETKDFTGTIPYEVLRILNYNYGSTQDYLSTYKQKAETQSIWFNMDNDFRNFLAELLNPVRQVSGLRVYIGEYDKSTIPPGKPEIDYLKKITVGFIATKFENGKHIDHPDETTKKSNLAIDAYNHGELCPPQSPSCP